MSKGVLLTQGFLARVESYAYDMFFLVETPRLYHGKEVNVAQNPDYESEKKQKRDSFISKSVHSNNLKTAPGGKFWGGLGGGIKIFAFLKVPFSNLCFNVGRDLM